MFTYVFGTWKRRAKTDCEYIKEECIMTLAIMQPYLFPYIGYWQLVNAVDVFVIYDDVNFMKQSYINRNSILSHNQSQTFTLELLKASPNKLINEIEMGTNKVKLLKTIKQNYIKAPYFDTVFSMIEEILNNEETNLVKFIGYSIKKISHYLDIDTKCIYSSDMDKNNNLKAQEKVLDICKRLEAKNYVNAIGGQELYDKEKFQEKDIKLSFLETELVEYKQFKKEFIPYLSIIDIMMFNSKDEIKIMLTRYKLI